jgi:integrase
MMTALDDGIIDRNPCRIRGAGSEPTPERPALTVAQVFALATKVPERYSVLVLVATFGSLPWSEVAALRRRDVSIRTGAIRVERALVERSSGSWSSLRRSRVPAAAPWQCPARWSSCCAHT